MVMFYALTVLCLSGTVMSQLAGVGPCPNIKPLPTFQLADIEGTWYEARRYLIPGQVNLKCIKSELKLTEKNDTLILDASAKSIVSEVVSSTKGLIVSAPDPLVPGQLEIKDPAGHKYGNYAILGTDYISYIVGYNCIDLKLINFKYVWVSSRTKIPSDEALDKAFGVLNNQNLPTKVLLISDQSNCEAKDSAYEIPEELIEKFNLLY